MSGYGAGKALNGLLVALLRSMTNWIGRVYVALLICRKFLGESFWRKLSTTFDIFRHDMRHVCRQTI